MMDGVHNGMNGGWWILMILFWIGLIAAIVWAGARVSARPGPADHPGGAGGRPGEILARRLASGEIDAETYDVLRAKLRAANEG